MDKKVSEQIKRFLEFEEDPDKIAEIGMRVHQNRVQRRVYKDIYKVTAPVIEFARDPQNKKALDSARQLLGKVRKVEKYHETRVYIPRIKESD